MNKFPNPRGGFTLIELMIVIGLMGLLTLFALPAFQDANRGGKARTAIFRLNASMGLARQTAITTRQPVYVVFPDEFLTYDEDTFGLAYTAYAIYGEKDKYIGEWRRLPEGVVFHADWAFPDETGREIRNIFIQDTQNFEVTDIDFPRANSGTQESMLGFTFRPDGTLAVAGFREKGIYLTDGWVEYDQTDVPPTFQSLNYMPDATVFGLEIRPETGQTRMREYNP